MIVQSRKVFERDDNVWRTFVSPIEKGDNGHKWTYSGADVGSCAAASWQRGFKEIAAKEGAGNDYQSHESGSGAIRLAGRGG